MKYKFLYPVWLSPTCIYYTGFSVDRWRDPYIYAGILK